MKELQVVDMRVVPGDSAYLIYNDTTTILYDSGFAFTGYDLARKIKETLGERKLDYIFLTHSHYDHCLGSAYVKKAYPEAVVIAGRHTAEVFARPHAILKMRELDNAHAKHYGIGEYEFLGDTLSVDVVVKEGDEIGCGDLLFRVYEFPGHTKCSIGFYEINKKLLLSSETLGIYHGDGILPICLTGFSDALRSISKLKTLDIEHLLVPHLGLIDRKATKHYLSIVEGEFQKAKELIISSLQEGKDKEKIIEEFAKIFTGGPIHDIYPPDASHLNTSLMIDLIKKEFFD